MNVFTKDELYELINEQAQWCATLYLPTHRSLPGAKQDPIRFKNLLRATETALEERGLRTVEVEDFLHPARELLNDSLFWRHQSYGLAVFLTKGVFRNYRVPISFRQLSVVSDRFHIKPLLPLVSSDNRFFILAVSQKEVRLIEGTRFGVHQIELENAPRSFAEILEGYDFEQQLQFHTRAQQVSGRQAAVFHGQGGGNEDLKPKIIEYFRRIDEAVRVALKDEKAPLVLAGVESVFPIYREVTGYGQILDEGIKGNPESMSSEELVEQGRRLVEPRFLRARERAADRYHALVGTGLTSNDLKEIVSASYEGRIEVLFIALGIQVWGTYDTQTRSVVLREQATSGDRDLLDVSAVHTLLNRGLVYPVEPEAVPGGKLSAAVYRY